MPFTEANQGNLTRFLPAPAFEVFLKAANEAEQSGLQYNDCIKQGWAATREAGYQPPAKGKKWTLVNKDDPGSGDVHVQRPLGSKKKPDPDDCDPAEYAQKFEIGSEATVCKVDSNLGLVFGFAIVCKKDGENYFDTQDDHIPEDSMLKAATEFMENSRLSKDMHRQNDKDGFGSVVFAFPLTSDIAKAMGIETTTTGLMIAMKPPAHILGKYQSGEYTGFSIGGHRVEDEEVD